MRALLLTLLIAAAAAGQADPRHIVNAPVIPDEFYADQPYVVKTDDGAWLCVITTGLARRLFPYQDPLDHTVKIDAFYYRVVGIVEERGQPEKRAQAGKMEGEPLDNNVYIPLSTSRCQR